MEKITIIIHDGVVFATSHPVTCVQPSKVDFITSIDAPFEREMGKKTCRQGMCEGKNRRKISDLYLLGSGQVLCGLFLRGSTGICLPQVEH